jgi:hypothetical protein
MIQLLGLMEDNCVDSAKVATIFAEETHCAANFNGWMGKTS